MTYNSNKNYLEQLLKNWTYTEGDVTLKCVSCSISGETLSSQWEEINFDETSEPLSESQYNSITKAAHGDLVELWQAIQDGDLV